MQRFVARQNVERFRQQLLDSNTDGARRSLVLKLLIEEEDKLGRTREVLREMEQQILTIKQIIDKQRETLAMLKSNGHSMERAERTLSNLLDLLATYEMHHNKIEVALSGNSGLPADGVLHHRHHGPAH